MIKIHNIKDRMKKRNYYKKLLKCGSLRLLNKKIPLKITHIITNRCNLNCNYCYINHNLKNEMTTEQIKKMLKEFYKAGTQTYGVTGGEPLLRDDFGIITRTAKDFGYYMTLGTNGTLIKDKISDVAKYDKVLLSLNGLRDANDKQRGEGTYYAVVDAINTLKSIGITPTVNFVITDNNYEEIEKLNNFSKLYKVNLTFQPLESFGHIKNVKVEDDTIKEIIDLKKENKYLTSSYSSLYQTLKSGKFQPKCLSGKTFCAITPEGNVVPCLHFLDRKEFFNGLDIGFVNAFYKLPDMSGCDCKMYCLYDVNKLHSLNPKYMVEVLYGQATSKRMQ